jgi:tripartite-type tricarboxylate transporter receptor subunit TctC
MKSESVRPVATMAHKRSRFFPDTPTIFETAGLTPEQKFWFDLRTNIDVFGRILVAPPGMSKERLEVLQEATRKALTDPELIAEGERSLRYIEYQDAEAIRKLEVDIFSKVDPATRDRINVVMRKTE